MYQSTAEFGNLVQQDSRTFKCLLTYDKVSITKVKGVKASRPVKMELAATASCINTVQVHQIFSQKTGRRYTIHTWKETHCIT